MEQKLILSHGALRTPCLIREPDYGTPSRIVLGVHGLAGSMHDDIQEAIAEEMELFGSVSVRFDFPAHGENPSDDLNLRDCLDTLLAVAEHARERYPELEDLCIFATGFGAYVTLIAMEELLELPGRIRLVVQTPSIRMDETILAMKRITLPTLRAMDRVTFRFKRPVDLTYRFHQELARNNAMTACPIPVLILHGEQDDFIKMEDIQLFHAANDRSKLVIIPGTSHRFLEEGAWDMVLDLTRDWFEFEQVLLV